MANLGLTMWKFFSAVYVLIQVVEKVQAYNCGKFEYKSENTGECFPCHICPKNIDQAVQEGSLQIGCQKTVSPEWHSQDLIRCFGKKHILPTCKPWSDPHGKVVCSGGVGGTMTINSQCLLACDDKYVSSSKTNITCTGDLTWDAELPKCILKVQRTHPHFSHTPNDTTVNPGGSANLTCDAIGSPMPVVKWKSDEKDIKSKNISSNGRSILHLENIRESARYTCIASSIVGKIETTALVTVKAINSESEFSLTETVIIVIVVIAVTVVTFFSVVLFCCLRKKKTPDIEDIELRYIEHLRRPDSPPSVIEPDRDPDSPPSVIEPLMQNPDRDPDMGHVRRPDYPPYVIEPLMQNPDGDPVTIEMATAEQLRILSQNFTDMEKLSTIFDQVRIKDGNITWHNIAADILHLSMDEISQIEYHKKGSITDGPTQRVMFMMVEKGITLYELNKYLHGSKGSEKALDIVKRYFLNQNFETV